MVAGCLAAPVGFTLSALLLIPLWWRWPFSTGDSSAMGPTFVSFLVGVAYAIAFGLATAMGLPKRGWVAAAVVLGGAAAGLALAAAFRGAMFEGCLLGTGPQPDWCHQDDPPFLRSMPPAYAAAGALLGLALYVAGTLGLNRAVPRSE